MASCSQKVPCLGVFLVFLVLFPFTFAKIKMIETFRTLYAVTVRYLYGTTLY